MLSDMDIRPLPSLVSYYSLNSNGEISASPSGMPDFFIDRKSFPSLREPEVAKKVTETYGTRFGVMHTYEFQPIPVRPESMYILG